MFHLLIFRVTFVSSFLCFGWFDIWGNAHICFPPSEFRSIPLSYLPVQYEAWACSWLVYISIKTRENGFETGNLALTEGKKILLPVTLKLKLFSLIQFLQKPKRKNPKLRFAGSLLPPFCQHVVDMRLPGNPRRLLQDTFVPQQEKATRSDYFCDFDLRWADHRNTMTRTRVVHAIVPTCTIISPLLPPYFRS